jgi:hypothetical protein
LNKQYFLSIKFVLGPSRDQEIAIFSWYTRYVHLPAYMHERALLLRDSWKAVNSFQAIRVFVGIFY